MSELRAAAESIADQLVAWRRHLHAHPELSTQEEQTAAYVAAALRAMGYEPVERVGGMFGLTATLQIGDQPAVALRADMDALPITEETGLDFASRVPGVMHACGHDAHMAMLLGAARLLADRRDTLGRPVRFIFQPSEERAPGGAAPMIDAGVLEGVGSVFGLHIWSEMPLGTLGTRVGPFMSGSDDIRITVTGQGGHAAMPHKCVDPVVAGSHIVLSLHTAISRSLAMTEGAVMSITQFHAGAANNVVPSSAALGGTLRTLEPGTRDRLMNRIRELAGDVAKAHGATSEVEIHPGYPPVVNDEASVSHALACARAIGLPDNNLITLPPQAVGEDFAYYARKVPAAFLFLGARNEFKGCRLPHHHPRFDIDEDALPIGAALLAAIAMVRSDRRGQPCSQRLGVDPV